MALFHHLLWLGEGPLHTSGRSENVHKQPSPALPPGCLSSTSRPRFRKAQWKSDPISQGRLTPRKGRDLSKTTQLEPLINSCHVTCGLRSCFQRQSKMWYAARQAITSGASSTHLQPTRRFLPQSWGVAVTLKPEPSRFRKQLD